MHWLSTLPVMFYLFCHHSSPWYTTSGALPLVFSSLFASASSHSTIQYPHLLVGYLSARYVGCNSHLFSSLIVRFPSLFVAQLLIATLSVLFLLHCLLLYPQSSPQFLHSMFGSSPPMLYHTGPSGWPPARHHALCILFISEYLLSDHDVSPEYLSVSKRYFHHLLVNQLKCHNGCLLFFSIPVSPNVRGLVDYHSLCPHVVG